MAAVPVTRPVRQIDERPAVLEEPARHWPARPSWTCDADGEDWPCADLRGHLLATMTRSEISTTMGGYYQPAMRELSAEPAVVHARLFGWHRHEGWRPPGGPW